MTVTLGNIRIDNVDGKFIRLTIDAHPFLSPELDESEAAGETLAEALTNLQELVALSQEIG